MTAGAILLAAGAATRMGCSKQLLSYRGQTLVERAIQQAQMSGFSPIVVVLGAEAAAVQEAVNRTAGHSVINQNWPSGMGSSITTGLREMVAIAPSSASVALLLTDQPHITADHLCAMRSAFEAGSAPILAASYAGTLGVPALFRSDVFHALENLAPEAGARTLLRGGGFLVQAFPLAEAAIDIDTPQDFNDLQLAQAAEEANLQK